MSVFGTIPRLYHKRYGEFPRNARQGTENQLIELREFAAKEGLTIVREYIDQKSGKNGDRPEF